MFNKIKLPFFNKVWNYIKPRLIKYKLGGKFYPIKDGTPEESHVDCSGFVRWFTYHASGGTVNMPDGSWVQRVWCKDEGFEYVDYSKAIADKSDSVYIAFYAPVPPRVGHVWLIRKGVAYQSSGGVGINSKKASDLWMRSHCHACFKLS